MKIPNLLNFTILFLFLTNFSAFSQTKEDIKKIVDGYDLKKINELKIKNEIQGKLDEIEVANYLKRNNLSSRMVKSLNGEKKYISHIDEFGNPVFVKLHSKLSLNNIQNQIGSTCYDYRRSINSTRANFLHTGGRSWA